MCCYKYYNKYAWVVLLKDKKGIAINKALQNILYVPNRKPNKLWVDKGSKYYNRSIKTWLQNNGIEIYSRQ